MDIHPAYDNCLSDEAKETLKGLDDSKRYDVATELAFNREQIVSLKEHERRIQEKHPDRPDLLLAIREQTVSAVTSFLKNAKTAREVENAGSVFTDEKVAALIDKIASIVAYHISDHTEKCRVLEDLNHIAGMFRQTSAQGTLLTPDQDASMMDATVPLLEEA